MARLPVDVVAKLSVRVKRGQQGYWDIVRDLVRQGDGIVTARAVHDRAGGHAASVRDYLRRLERAGILIRIHPEPGSGSGRAAIAQWRLGRRCGPEAPRLRRDGTPATPAMGQEQMWRVLKMAGAGGVSAADLAWTASTEEHPVRAATAAAYLSALRRAGYLAVVASGKPGHRRGTGRQAVYRLLPDMNTGPLAPQIQRIKAVWDPNLGRHMGEAEARADGDPT